MPTTRTIVTSVKIGKAMSRLMLILFVSVVVVVKGVDKLKLYKRNRSISLQRYDNTTFCIFDND